MAKRPTGKKPSNNPTNKPHNLEQDIRRRAYQLYEERGREDGRELEDWLHAEEEVKQKKIHVVVV